MKKKALSLLLTLAMLLSLVPAFGIGAAATQTTIQYRYPEYNTANNPASGIKQWHEDGSCTSYTYVTSTDTTWGTAGQTTWYVTDGTVSISNTVTVAGDVYLILADNAKLFVTGSDGKAGICVSGEGNSLTVYGQKNGTGTLRVEGGSENSWQSIKGGAAIGGNGDSTGSHITINGGIVSAYSNSMNYHYGSGAAIGGGYGGAGSDITINGGIVTAEGAYGGAGIGGGKGGNASNIIINGGMLSAFGYESSDIGIGSGTGGSASGIFVADDLIVKAGSSSDPKTVVADSHTSSDDISSDLAGKRYVKIAPPVSYRSPEYNTTDDPASGVAQWGTDTCTVYTEITPANIPYYLGTTGEESWYVVTGTVNTYNFTIRGNVNLILTDGSSLTAAHYAAATGNGGNAISVESGASLTIYDQSAGTGKLSVTGGNGGTGSPNGTEADGGSANGGAGITGSGTVIIINGGTITVTGGNGGTGGSTTSDTTNGGHAHGGAGIVGSAVINSGILQVTGGTGGTGGNAVPSGLGSRGTAHGGAGIVGTVAVNGGSVEATGGASGTHGEGQGVDAQPGNAISAASLNGSFIIMAGDTKASATKVTSVGFQKYVSIAPAMTLLVNSSAADDSATRAANATYKTIAGALAKAENNDIIQLLSDVTANITIASGKNITLDLNGYVLKGDGVAPTSESKNHSVITNNGTLYITDSDTSVTRYFADQECKHGKTIGTTCTDCGTLAIADGCFENYYTEQPIGIEGTDYITVTGGCITGGTGTDAGSDGVCGGGIFNTGSLYLQSGNVVGNSTVDEGGGICNFAGTVVISGGSILGNTADGGAGIYSRKSNANITVSGGEISYNTASSEGGGINNNSVSSCTITGGEISYNSAESGGGVSGGETFTMTGGIITANKASIAGGFCCSHHSESIFGGTAVVAGNTLSDGTTASNVVVIAAIESFVKISNVNAPQTGMNIGVTQLNLDTYGASTGKFTTNGSANELPYFFSDSEAYGVKFDTDHFELIAVNNAVSLTADAKIGINFYLDVEAYLDDLTNAKVELTYNHNRTTYATNLSTDTIPVEASQKQASGQVMAGSYLYTAYVAPDQMKDDVTIKLKDGSGSVVYTKTYTVADYCNYVCDCYDDGNPITGFSDGTGAKLYNLCRAMLDYGSAAQTNFGYNKSNLANGGTWKDSTLPSASAASYTTNYFAYYTASDFGSGEAVFYDGVELRVYPTASANLTSDTVIDVKLYGTSTSIDSSRFGQRADAKGNRYVYVNGIAPNDFDKNYLITFDGTNKFCVSALGFARVNMGKVSAAENLLLQAMVKYYQAAATYFTSV